MKINRNMSAVITNNQLLRTERKLSASMERLSSGLKINHAGDNPAGMAISNKMRTQIDALDQAEMNAADGESVLQIADGALNEVTAILQRVRELSVQAASDTNTFADKESIQKEIDELVKEVDRISKDTEFNSKTLLDGSSDVRSYGEGYTRLDVSDTVPVGVYEIEIIANATPAEETFTIPTTPIAVDGTININGAVGEITAGMTPEQVEQVIRDTAENAGATLTTPAAGQVTITSDNLGSATQLSFIISPDLANELGLTGYTANEDNAMEKTVAGTDAQVNQDVTYDGALLSENTIITTDGNRVTVTDTNGFYMDFLADADATTVEIEVTDIGPMTIQIGGNQYQTMDVRIPEISTESLYLDTVNVVPKFGADRAITTADKAIAHLSEIRSRIGAFQNRLTYAQSSLSETGENMTAAYSRIVDTDMAQEMTEYTQQTVLEQAAISVLAQANELPQQVLSLLQ